MASKEELVLDPTVDEIIVYPHTVPKALCENKEPYKKQY